MKAQKLLLFVIVVLVVYCQAAFDGLRQLLAVQPDLLPSLVVYAALAGRMSSVLMVAAGGGLLFDSLSANPLAVSVLPLSLVGLTMHHVREKILRDQWFAQFVLGGIAGGVVPLISILLLLTFGYNPVVGWGTLWQVIFMSVVTAIVTPGWFALFSWLKRTLDYGHMPETAFRQDREIRRGRS